MDGSGVGVGTAISLAVRAPGKENHVDAPGAKVPAGSPTITQALARLKLQNVTPALA